MPFSPKASAKKLLPRAHAYPRPMATVDVVLFTVVDEIVEPTQDRQRPGRSRILFGTPAAVCVRCFGIYAGAAIGSLLRTNYGVAIRALGAGLALNCVDVASESFGIHGNMPLLR